jgi:hypothetical protein
MRIPETVQKIGECRIMKRALLALVAILSPTMTMAEGITGDTCNKLAAAIAIGDSQSFSERQFDALRYYAVCDAAQSSSGGSASVGWAGFNLVGKYEEAKSQQSCSKDYRSNNIKTTDYFYVKTLFDKALTTIDKCLMYAAKGWDVQYEVLTPDSVSLLISNSNGTGGLLKSISVVSDNKVTCKPSLPLKDTVVKTGDSSFYTVCSRTPTKQMNNGMELVTAHDAVINVTLAEGILPIRMPGYGSSKAIRGNDSKGSVRKT